MSEENPFGNTKNSGPSSPNLGSDHVNVPIDDTPISNSENFIVPQERPKNFPPCKPVFHHSIRTDIEQPTRMMVRRGYIGWYFHVFLLLVNFIAVTIGLVVIPADISILTMIESLLYLIFDSAIAFLVYLCLYTAARKRSAFWYGFWFCLTVCEIAFYIFLAIGVSGGAGIVLMSDAFGKDNVVLGSICAIAAFGWIAMAVYRGFILKTAFSEYRSLGGNKAALRNIGQGVAQTAYENRDTIKQVAVENKDVIKKVVAENKDVIVKVALDNKDVIKQVALDN